MTIRVLRMDGNPKVLYDEGHPPPVDLAVNMRREACRECAATVHFEATDRGWRTTIVHEESCPDLALARASMGTKVSTRIGRAAVARWRALGLNVEDGYLGELREYVPDEGPT